MALYAGNPFWRESTNSPDLFPKLQQSQQADIIIIGAGISGALTGYLASREGFDVIVVDSADPVQGSSAASTGILQYETDYNLHELTKKIGKEKAGAWYRSANRAVDNLAELHKATGVEQEFFYRPSIYLSESPVHENELKKELNARNETGLKCEWLNEGDLDNYGLKGACGILNQHSAVTDASRFTQALLAHITKNRGYVYAFSEVNALRQEKDYMILTVKDKPDVILKAKYVVVATGYHTPSFVKLPQSETVLTYAVAGLPEIPPLYKGILWTYTQPYNYIRTDSDIMIIGGGDEHADLDKGKTRMEQIALELRNKFRSIYKGINLYITNKWVSEFKTGWLGLPRSGWYGDGKSVYTIQAYGGNGIIFSLLAAESFTDEIMRLRR